MIHRFGPVGCVSFQTSQQTDLPDAEKPISVEQKPKLLRPRRKEEKRKEQEESGKLIFREVPAYMRLISRLHRAAKLENRSLRPTNRSLRLARDPPAISKPVAKRKEQAPQRRSRRARSTVNRRRRRVDRMSSAVSLKVAGSFWYLLARYVKVAYARDQVAAASSIFVRSCRMP